MPFFDGTVNVIDNQFFEESNKQSQVKAAIVSKYFNAWARIIIGSQNKNRVGGNHRIANIDLFAGPGRYVDGTISTPLKILDLAIQNDVMRDRLVTVFNDKDSDNTSNLQNAIEEIPGIETLKYKPQVVTSEIDSEITHRFNEMRFVPTFLFVDPWGYKGLTRSLIYSVVKDWGCDCVFFFNYNRINMGLNNDMVREHMDALFGEDQVAYLRESIESLNPPDREKMVIDTLCNALRDMGPEYVLTFRFKDDAGSRTSHFLIFVSKNFKGYETMKEVMAKESSNTQHGVASFEYSPFVEPLSNQQMLPLLPSFNPLEELGEELLEKYAGSIITMKEIYLQHSLNRPYISKNYKDALILLESSHKIEASPHRSGTFGDDVIVTFPSSN